MLCRGTQSVELREAPRWAVKTLIWRGRGGRRRLCCRVLASPQIYLTVNVLSYSDLALNTPLSAHVLGEFSVFTQVFLTRFGTICCRPHRSPRHTLNIYIMLHVLCVTPKTCLPFMFILFSLPPLSLLVGPCCMKTHQLTHSFTHLLCTSPPSNIHCLTHCTLTLTDHWQTHTHVFTAQPLRVVTEDTCLFHYLVPAPMSPSNKSVGSDAGSQDSVDGTAGPRSV